MLQKGPQGPMLLYRYVFKPACFRRVVADLSIVYNMYNMYNIGCTVFDFSPPHHLSRCHGMQSRVLWTSCNKLFPFLLINGLICGTWCSLGVAPCSATDALLEPYAAIMACQHTSAHNTHTHTATRWRQPEVQPPPPPAP